MYWIKKFIISKISKRVSVLKLEERKTMSIYKWMQEEIEECFAIENEIFVYFFISFSLTILCVLHFYKPYKLSHLTYHYFKPEG